MSDGGRHMGEDTLNGAALIATLAGLALFWMALIYGTLHVLR